MRLSKKVTMLSIAALMGIAPLMSVSANAHTVQAADTNVTNKMIMHTSIAYNKDGNSTGTKYNAYSYCL